MKHIKYLTRKMGSALLLCAIVIISNNSRAQYSFSVEKTGSGQAVILIPGLITSGEVWDESVRALSDQFECHVITLAGYAGQPPLEQGPYLPTFKNELIRYIENNNLDKVSLIGHSLGGFLSLLIGLENLAVIERIIVVDALPFLPALSNPGATASFEEEMAMQYFNNLQQMDDEQRMSFRLMTARSMTNDSTKWEQLVRWFNDSDPKTEAYSSFEMMGMDLRHELHELNVPTMVLVPHDENPDFPLFTGKMALQMYHDQYAKAPQVQITLVDEAKHFLMYDQPELFIKQIRGFLTE